MRGDATMTETTGPSSEFVLLPPPALQKSGRKTKLTPEVRTLIIDRLTRGNYLSTAAAEAGINSTTLAAWIRRGRELVEISEEVERSLSDEEQMFADFYTEVEQARAKAEVLAIEGIRKAGVSNWQAHAWWLERSQPQKWGKVVRNEHTGSDGGPIEIDSAAVMRKLEALLSRNVPSEGDIIDAELVEDDSVNPDE